MNTPKLGDEQIEEIQGKAYRDLVAKGYDGGMGSLQWDRASARAIEAATAAKMAERIADLEQRVQAAEERSTFLTAMTREAQDLGRMYADQWEASKERIAEQALQLLSAQAQAQENHERAERAEQASRYEADLCQQALESRAELESALKLTLDALTYQGNMGPTRRQRRKAAIDAAIDAMRTGEPKV